MDKGKRIDYRLLLKMISNDPQKHCSSYQALCSPHREDFRNNSCVSNIRKILKQ